MNLRRRGNESTVSTANSRQKAGVSDPPRAPDAKHACASSECTWISRGMDGRNITDALPYMALFIACPSSSKQDK
jgi:hypothetical protein